MHILFYRIGICMFLSRATFVDFKFGWGAKSVKRHASFLFCNILFIASAILTADAFFTLI